MLKPGGALRRSYPHIFIVADVLCPIISADFLNRFNRSLNVRMQCLTDAFTGLAVTDIIPDIYPLQRIPDCVSSIHGMNVF